LETSIFPILAAASGHSEPIARLVLWLAVILALAKVGGDLASRLGQPAVLGELVLGIVLGNLSLLGFSGFEEIKTDHGLEILARIGVLVLLFEVGLESTVDQMAKVGVSSFLVATIGVAVPFALGWLVGAWLLPQEGGYVHAFIGATLTATSVGITARVMKDLGKSKAPEARVILGAAVIDDVLGLIILAATSGIIAAADHGSEFSWFSIAGIAGKAFAFLGISILLGVLLSRRLFSLVSRLRSPGALLAAGLSFCFFLAYLASLVGLEPIVGAFAAGLILEEEHSKIFERKGEKPLEESIEPIGSFLAPIFFVLMGIRTDLRAFGQPDALAIAGILTAVAVAGKLVSAIGVLGNTIDRLSVGIGMIPRGEVGLIFASIGMSLSIAGKPIVSGTLFSEIVVMVVLTTLVTPPALKWSLGRRRRIDTGGA
jgi:Kef-type K+ transport system membrane component KefB